MEEIKQGHLFNDIIGFPAASEVYRFLKKKINNPDQVRPHGNTLLEKYIFQRSKKAFFSLSEYAPHLNSLHCSNSTSR